MNTIWLKIDIGGPEDYYSIKGRLIRTNIKVSNDADEVLSVLSFQKTEIIETNLEVVTPKDLRFFKKPSLAGMYAQAKENGLLLLPPEAGFLARLKYKNQPRNKVLHIGMNPIKVFRKNVILCLTSDDTRNIETLQVNHCSLLELNVKFVFCRK